MSDDEVLSDVLSSPLSGTLGITVLNLGLEFALSTRPIPHLVHVFLIGIPEVLTTLLHRKDYLSVVRSQRGPLMLLADSYEQYSSCCPRVKGTVKRRQRSERAGRKI